MLVKFEIYSDGKYWCGRGIGVDIFTQGKTLDELMVNIREAIELHFEEELGKGENIRILSISETEVGNVARSAMMKTAPKGFFGLLPDWNIDTQALKTELRD